MTHNALSRGIGSVPMWFIQAILGVLLTSALAWGTWASVTTWKHETRIAVTERDVSTLKDNIKEIKDGNREMNRKLDRLLERPPR
jgi:hypothetical protein